MAIVAVPRNEIELNLTLPQYESRVPAGFPSPADDYMDKGLDLNEHLILHPAATFYCRVIGESMRELGIFDGDLLIVDRAIEAQHGDVVLAAVDGELACKVLDLRRRRLLSANDEYPPIVIAEGSECQVEGVVTSSIRRHRCLR